MSNHSKTWLNEISFMRPVLLVLLVAYHAFAPYVGAWVMPDGIQEVDTYRWIGRLAYSFLLEGFVFISGYVFTYQVVERHKFRSFRSLLVSKIQRLLIPSFFFSALYIFCLEDASSYGGIQICLALLGGVGHLWYLPCLFWCFLIQYLLLKKNLPVAWCLLFLLVMVVISVIPLPIKLNIPCYYMLFFYVGGLFWRSSREYRRIVTNKKKSISVMWFGFALLFVAISYMMDAVHDTYIIISRDNLFIRCLFLEINKTLKIVLSWAGIITLYLTACRYCATHQIGRTIIKIGACGYGVYVFHQFILVYLYRHTEMPSLIGSYLLPWVGFFIALIISVILTLAVRSTRIGRKFL